jgi:pyruvate/2-oxoglutarate dehydrogenase complex dihydrolipoamide acyltransferase (E2) component
MGTGVQDVVIEEWYVQVGDQVSAGQPLVLVETDKTTTEIESPVAGTVRRLLVEEGVEALVGAVIAEIAPS